MSFSLIEADSQHIDSIMEIEKQCFIPQIQERREVFLDRIKAGKGKETFLLFIDDETGRPSGYICGEYMKQIPSSPEEIALNHTPVHLEIAFEIGRDFESTYPVFYISSFGILGQYRGKGNGSRLRKQSRKHFEKLPGVKKLVLLVNENWSGARHIYQSTGFSVTATFDQFFPDGNGIIMEKNIAL